jgi:hypothetical protein
MWPTEDCICPTPARLPDGTFDWQIRDECPYHSYAAAHPDDHQIPWNCPTFYDGCNCAPVTTSAASAP